jgi:Sel1 repeat-containing protein
VPAPPEDDRKTGENLPDPELNPMTNTLLAQNMGRWAEVYFTTPAEKRDAAVQELLRELRSGVKPTQNGISEEKITVSEQEILSAKQKFVELEEKLAELQRKPVEESASASSGSAGLDLTCPACLSKNKPGQRFCGLCGFTLSADRNSPSQAVPPLTQPNSEPPPIERAGDDWTWLHERNRTALVVEQRKATTWRYVVLVVFALMGCGLGYLWWRGSLQTSSAGEEERNTARRDASSVRSNAADETSSQQVPVGKGATSEPERANASKPEHKQATAQPSSEAEPRSVPPNSTIKDSIAEAGMQELETARRYLDGRGVPKDSSVAAQWLWKSIAKKNTQALITLSDMYAAGEGVPKNCDQARLLLSTAAQKGSQEARDKLKTVISSCQ